MGRLGQLLDRDVGARQVGIAKAEVDDVASAGARVGLQPVDLGEHVGRQARDAAKLHLRNVTERCFHVLQSRRSAAGVPATAQVAPAASSALKVARDVALEHARPRSPRPRASRVATVCASTPQKLRATPQSRAI